MPTIAELEQWMEEQLPQNLQDFHSRVHATILDYSAHLYEQIIDYTPSLAQIESSIPVLGPAVAHVATSSKQIITPTQPSQPPMPMYKAVACGLMARVDAITGSRRRTSVVAGIAVVGITCTVLTREAWLPAKYIQRPRRLPRNKNGLRCDAIVILGADTSLGQALSHQLAALGFIVLASVADEESKQSYDSLVPPSSRGYIKSIVLNTSANARAEDVTFFVRAVAAARELRWPLTAAGDPYARPGAEVDIVGVVNTLSYKPSRDGKSISSSLSASSSTTFGVHPLDLEMMARDMNQRAVIPLATIKALLPALVTKRVRSDEGVSNEARQPRLVLSIANAGDTSDTAAQALVAGMERIRKDIAAMDKDTARLLVATTLKVEPSSFMTLLQSVLPSFVGGAAPFPRPGLVRSGSNNVTDTTANGRRALDTSARIVERGPRTPLNRSTMSSSATDARMQRGAETRAVLQAAMAILIETSVSSSHLRAWFTVRLPTSAPAREPRTASQDAFEPTLLSRAMRIAIAPFTLVAHALSSYDVRSLWNRGRCAQYQGTRNATNNRPAYGPGPGPASNTHSRSCIRQQQSQTQDDGIESNAQQRHHGNGPSRSTSADVNAKQRRGRPASTASVSSEAARSSESDGSRSAGQHSGHVSSAPPSNPDLSSSGLLSSVPSSAFGDASEEDRLVDSDFGSTDSPALGSTDDGPYARAGGRQSTGNASISSDGDGTALGARNYDATDAGSSMAADETPNASYHPQYHTGDRQHGYGFPNAAFLPKTGGADAPSAGLTGRNDTESARSFAHAPSASADVGASSAGTETPLGHSWVALGQSSLEQQSEHNRRPSDRRR